MLNTDVGSNQAEAYSSVAHADDYHQKRGNTAWALLDLDKKEAALRNASDYLTIIYVARWAGERVDDNQALDWPRRMFPGSDAGITLLPLALLNANASLALRASNGPLIDDLDAEIIEETIGPITTRYAPGAVRQKSYPEINGMLAPLLIPKSNVFVRI